IDVPCSRIDVINNNSDIKYNKSLADVEKLQLVQGDILEEAVNLLKKDGELVYRTCTVNKLENNHVIKTVLNKHPEFEVESNCIDSLPQSVIESSQKTDYGIQLFPYARSSDAFVITKLKYKR